MPNCGDSARVAKRLRQQPRGSYQRKIITAIKLIAVIVAIKIKISLPWATEEAGASGSVRFRLTTCVGLHHVPSFSTLTDRQKGN